MVLSPDAMRGLNDILILSLLKKSDNYGYNISQEILEQSQGAYTIKETTLYSALNRLEKNGYIVSYIGKETNGPPRTYFKLSTLGKKYLNSKIEEWYTLEELLHRFVE